MGRTPRIHRRGWLATSSAAARATTGNQRQPRRGTLLRAGRGGRPESVVVNLGIRGCGSARAGGLVDPLHPGARRTTQTRRRAPGGLLRSALTRRSCVELLRACGVALHRFGEFAGLGFICRPAASAASRLTENASFACTIPIDTTAAPGVSASSSTTIVSTGWPSAVFSIARTCDTGSTRHEDHVRALMRSAFVHCPRQRRDLERVFALQGRRESGCGCAATTATTKQVRCSDRNADAGPLDEVRFTLR